METSYSGSPAGIFPESSSIASRTSRPFPTAMPSGWFMSVMIATVRLPMCRPISTMVRASSLASGSVCMNAPVPIFTSSTIASAPAAIFLLITLDAMSGMLLTVPVTSRSAYMRLSAGTRFSVCPITQRPVSFTISKNRPIGISIFTPGTDSSLSSVPPVCPRPRPDIFATVPPQAATSGATISVVVSPTPPVECLSTFTPGSAERSTCAPERIIASVRAPVSALSIP